LGYDPFVAGRGRKVVVLITRDGPGYVAALGLFDDAGRAVGRREVRAGTQDCGELTSVLALAISIALDPLGEGAAQPTLRDAGSEAPDQDAAPRDALSAQLAHDAHASRDASTAPPSTAADPVRLAGYMGFAPTFGGAAPDVAFAAGLGAELRFGAWGGGLEGRAQFASSTDVAQDLAPAGTEVSTSILALATPLCGYRANFGFCFVPTVGSLRARTTALRSLPESGLYASLGARALYELWLSQALGLAAYVEGHALLTPTRLLLQSGIAWESAPIGASLGVMVKVRTP
jgi:hypothetical protein